MRCDESDGSQLEQRAARRRATVALHRTARTRTHLAHGNANTNNWERQTAGAKNLQLGRILMYILLFTMTRRAKAGGGGGAVHTDVGLQWREMCRQQRRRSSSVGNIYIYFFLLPSV